MRSRVRCNDFTKPSSVCPRTLAYVKCARFFHVERAFDCFVVTKWACDAASNTLRLLCNSKKYASGIAHAIDCEMMPTAQPRTRTYAADTLTCACVDAHQVRARLRKLASIRGRDSHRALK